MIRGIFIALILGAFTFPCGTQGHAAVVKGLELITNGGFETGTFSGWQTSRPNTTDPGWSINDGTLQGTFGGPRDPISGEYDVAVVHQNQGISSLWQSFTFPTAPAPATFVTWSDRIFNNSMFQDPSQEFRVFLRANQTATPALMLFSTNAGDPPLQPGPNKRSVDISNFAATNSGETFELVFQEEHTNQQFNVFVDDVSVVAVPEPSSLALLGLGLAGTTVGAARRRRKNKLASVLG